MGLVLPPIEAYQVQHLPMVKAYADKIGLVDAIIRWCRPRWGSIQGRLCWG